MTGTRSTLARAPLWAAAVVALLLHGGPALAAAMQVMESRPAAQAVMDRGQTEFFVRFDGPVDHAASLLSVVQDGHVVQVLHPRLNSRPNTLYSGIRRLTPGAYMLHWSVRAAHSHDLTEGDIAFSVK